MDNWLIALLTGWRLLYGLLTDSPQHFLSSGLAGLSVWCSMVITSRLLYRKCSPRFMAVLRESHLGSCIDLSIMSLVVFVSLWRHLAQDGLWP